MKSHSDPKLRFENYHSSKLEMQHIPVKKLYKDSVMPKKANPDDAGFDLCVRFGTAGYSDDACVSSASEVYIPPGTRCMMSTGIRMAIPRGYYGRIAPRSGLALKNGIDVLAGVVDSSYRGEIKVILLNTGSEAFRVVSGDRIAQIIIEKCDNFVMQEVEDLDQTVRGEGGFGSTGL